MQNKKLYTLIIAYLLVITIWSTTPLAIKWSGESVGFIFGVTARMFIGAGLALLLSLLYFKKLPMHRDAVKVYLVATLAIFGAMTTTYWGAQFISSGLVSVVFGLTPIVTAWMAARVLHENSLTPTKVIGSVTGILGLIIIFFEQLQLGEHAWMGLMAVFVAVILHASSSVLIKRVNVDLSALVVTTGGLLFSLPLFSLVYLLFAEPLPEYIPAKPLWSIIYLGAMGSVVGFVCYYYVLANLTASTVALITLLTPIAALWLGNVLNNEPITLVVIAGTTMVLSGLIIHQWSNVSLKP